MRSGSFKNTHDLYISMARTCDSGMLLEPRIIQIPRRINGQIQVCMIDTQAHRNEYAWYTN